MLKNNLEIGSVIHSFRPEGATRVWVEAHVGLNGLPKTSVASFAMHSTVERDGGVTPIDDNQYYSQFCGADIEVELLDRIDGSDQLAAPYTDEEIGRLSNFVEGRTVLTALEPNSLGAFSHLDPSKAPGLLLNTYRTADNRSDDELSAIRNGLSSGLVAMVTVDSDTAHRTYVEAGFSKDDIRVIYNGTDLEKFHYSEDRRSAMRRSLGIEDEAPVVMTVSRFSDEKDVPLFLDSARNYLHLDDEAHVVIVGAGLNADENPEFGELVREKFEDVSTAVLARLHGVGSTPNIEGYYPGADVIVGTPKADSRPLYIGEAFASGIPIAASTDVGDTAQMIGDNGIITSRDPEEIAEAWVEVYQHRGEIGFDYNNRDRLGPEPMVRAYRDAVLNVANV